MRASAHGALSSATIRLAQQFWVSLAATWVALAATPSFAFTQGIQLQPLIPVVDHRSEPLQGSASYVKGSVSHGHRWTRLNAHATRNKRHAIALRAVRGGSHAQLNRFMPAQFASLSRPFDLKAIAKQCTCGDYGLKLQKRHKWAAAALYYSDHLKNHKDEESQADDRNGIAWSLAHTGRLDESIRLASKSINLKQTYYAFGTRGYAYLRKGNYQNAIADLREALKRWPDDYEDRYYLALAYYRQGMLHDAQRELNIAKKGKYEDTSSDWRIATR